MIAGAHMLAKARRAREVFRFIRLNSPMYVRIFRLDMQAFREELIKTFAGLLIGAVAGLLFVAFLCIAVLISAWDTKLRIAAAWTVCAGWAVIALGGLAYARRAVSVPVPFANLTELLQRDLAAIEKVNHDSA